MPKKLIKPGILLATVFVVISLFFVTAGATTVDVLDGQVSVTDSANSNTVSDGTVTITATGSLFSKKTNNITITNETDSTVQLAFDYTVSSANSFKIAGVAANATGSYTVILEAGRTLKIELKSNSGLSNTTATLTLSNFSLTEAPDSFNVTINYDSTLGSVTAGGTAVTSDTTQEVSRVDGITLVATPASGTTFQGWVNASNGTVLSKETSYTLKPESDMTVKVAFVADGGTPWFGVGVATQKSESIGLLGMGRRYYYTVSSFVALFDDLNAAANYAASSTSKAVVLMNSGTLSAGDYTIPAGVTLLIPFDAANTLYTTEAQAEAKGSSWKNPTSYRTLTLANGANLIVNGAVSLSAKHIYAQGGYYGGTPTGNVSFVQMQGNSNITVNNGGALYAYGFITGSGSVTANSGSKVYECFQFMDFRGGTQSTDMQNGVFPLCQYYVQNIEVPMTLYSGAEEHAYTTIYMSSSQFGSDIKFIANSGAMFNLTSGYVVKRYDGATDRMVIELHGDMTVSNINMEVGTSSINSKNYDLPINSNITVTAKFGSKVTINQDLAFLPGSEMIIESGATCTIGSGYNVYIYDADQWGNFCYSGGKNNKFAALAYAPGRTYTRTDADLVDAKILVNGTFDASAGYLYTTAGGANIFSTGNGVVKLKAGTQTVTHQLVQGTGYTEIPITPAKLKNENGSYVETSSATTATSYYHDHYICECDLANGNDANGNQTNNVAHGTWATDHTVTETTTDPKCEERGYTTYACTCGKEACVGDYAAALGHTEVIDAAKAATCTETGLTQGKHCSVCEAIITAQKVVSALGHSSVTDVAVAPTCTATGLTEGCHCSVCNAVLIAQEVIDALGHTEVTDVAVAPTCTATGLTEGCHCSVCNEILDAQEVVAALGHAWTWGDWSSATNGQQCTCTCGNDDSHTITVLLAYRMDSYIWLNATVSSNVGTPVCNGMTLQSGKYLVQKVLSNHITDSVAVSFTLNGTTPELEIGFPQYSTLLKASIPTEETERTDAQKKLYNLLIAMENYGIAADKYFDNVGTTPDTVSKPGSSAAIQKPEKDSEYDKKGVGSLILDTTGATVFFDEALRLGVGYGFTGATVNADGTITIGTEKYTVLQVGVLTKQLTSWTMGNVLYADTVSGATAYIVYNGTNSGATVTPGGSLNKPDVGSNPISPSFTNSLAASGVITFDLSAAQYKSPFALRTYAVVLDSNNVQHVIYGGQYVYGLEAYIQNVFGTVDSDATTDDQAFDWLLSTVAAYAEAAYAKYGG